MGHGRGLGDTESLSFSDLQESPSREVGEPFPGAKDATPAFLAGSPGAPGSPSTPGLTPLTDHSPEGSEAEEGELRAGHNGREGRDLGWCHDGS